MSKQYHLTIAKDFPAATRGRAGVVIPRDGGLVTELDAEQLKAVKADPLITVRDHKEPAGDKGGTPPAGTGKAPAADDVQKPLTKDELLAAAEAEGLTLEGVTAKSKRDEIEAALNTARTAGEAPADAVQLIDTQQSKDA